MRQRSTCRKKGLGGTTHVGEGKEGGLGSRRRWDKASASVTGSSKLGLSELCHLESRGASPWCLTHYPSSNSHWGEGVILGRESDSNTPPPTLAPGEDLGSEERQQLYRVLEEMK